MSNTIKDRLRERLSKTKEDKTKLEHLKQELLQLQDGLEDDRYGVLYDMLCSDGLEDDRYGVLYDKLGVGERNPSAIDGKPSEELVGSKTKEQFAQDSDNPKLQK